MEKSRQSDIALNNTEQFKDNKKALPIDYYTGAEKRQKNTKVLESLKLRRVPSVVICGTEFKSKYYTYVKVQNHHFHIRVHKVKANKWKLEINLCLVDFNSDDILVYSEKRCKIKELKELAIRFINDYVESEQCLIDIEQWKNQNRQKVYDENFNYIGVAYHILPIEILTKEFTYYNDAKPDIESGTFYQKVDDIVLVHRIYDGRIITRRVVNDDILKILKEK